MSTPTNRFKDLETVEINDTQKVDKFDKKYIDALYYLKIDIVTNTLSPRIRSAFNKNNKSASNRLKELEKWKHEYINQKTLVIPRELVMLVKEMKL